MAQALGMTEEEERVPVLPSHVQHTLETAGGGGDAAHTGGSRNLLAPQARPDRALATCPPAPGNAEPLHTPPLLPRAGRAQPASRPRQGEESAFSNTSVGETGQSSLPGARRGPVSPPSAPRDGAGEASSPRHPRRRLTGAAGPRRGRRRRRQQQPQNPRPVSHSPIPATAEVPEAAKRPGAPSGGSTARSPPLASFPPAL